jgi:peptidoglycan/LPS O-acetylase OafA/YrhL
VIISIPCSSCSRPIELADSTCGGCGRKVSREELAALEERFAAANADYRQARGTVARALIVVLVCGLFSIALGAIRFVFGMSDTDTAESVVASVGSLLWGALLIALFIVGKRAPMLALSAATALWFAALVLPFVVDPAAGALALASVFGVALGVVRIGVLLVLARALQSAFQMKRLRQA